MADNIIQIDEDRKTRESLALEAAEQINGLCHMMLAELRVLEPVGASGIVASLIRIKELTSATMSALGDEIHDVDDLHLAVHGYRPEHA